MLSDFLKPHLKSFSNTFKDYTLKAYHQELFSQGQVVSPHFISEVLKNLEENYGPLEANDKSKIENTLLKPHMMFCANHGGFENHPQLIASTLMGSYFAPQCGLESNLILACTSISPKNATAPGGFFLGERRKAHNYRRESLNFIPRKYTMHYLRTIRALSSGDLKRKLATIKLNACEKEALENFKPEDFGESHFISQSFRANTFYYERFLSKVPHAKTYFLDDSIIASRLLICALNDPNSFTFKLFANPLKLFELCQHLQDRPNLWSKERISDNWKQDLTGKGTVLFYLRRPSGSIAQLSLIKDGDKVFFRSEEGSFEITPQNIIERLQNESLDPDLYLVYTCLSFDFKVTLIGGIFFNYYIKDMLEITSKFFNLDDVSTLSTRYVQSFLTPFKIITHAQDPLNGHRPLLNLDLKILDPISEEQIATLNEAKISQTLNLSITDMLLDFDLNMDEIAQNLWEILSSLKAQAPIELEL